MPEDDGLTPVDVEITDADGQHDGISTDDPDQVVPVGPEGPLMPIVDHKTEIRYRYTCEY